MKAFLKTLAISLSSLTLFCSFSIAQSSGNSARIERVTELSRAIERGSSKTRAAAKERFGLLRSLAESDPEAVLSAALPDDVLSRIPDASRQYLEVREKVEGELEVIAECEEHQGRIEYFVKQGSTRRQLYVAGEPDSPLLSGKKISVDALKLDDVLVARADSIKSTDAAAVGTSTQAALTGTTGEKRVLVILVNFQDNSAQPYTTAHARDVVFNQGTNFFRENSYGQTSLGGDVYGWYTLPISGASCDTNAIGTYARQAASNAGVNLAAYDHYVYGFPSTSTCGFSGRSSVGGTPSHLWVNSNLMGLQVFGHEFGHSLGLYHSRSLDCGTDVIGTACTSNEYGDTFDIMGISKTIHMNSYQKERLGWINAAGTPPLQTVTASGAYWVEAYAASPTGATKGLKILKSTDPTTGARTWYYLEYRAPVGYDSSLAMYGVQNGVVVRTGSESTGAETYLLDMTPATTSWYDAYISTGTTYTDNSAGLAFTVVSTDGAGAVVNVTVPGQACARNNPSVSLSPGQTNWLVSGSAFAYTATVTNNNSAGCPTENFSLSTSIPAGWGVYTAGSSTLSIAPGSSLSTTVNVTSPVGAADGNYAVSVAATNGSYSRSASATYSIVSRLSATAVAGASKYSRSQTATVTAFVSAAGSPVIGASVFFTMTKAGGAKVEQKAVTGSDGRAVFSYKFNRKSDPTGAYSVAVAAESNGYTGQAATSFTVTK